MVVQSPRCLPTSAAQHLSEHTPAVSSDSVSARRHQHSLDNPPAAYPWRSDTAYNTHSDRLRTTIVSADDGALKGEEEVEGT